MKYVFLIYQDRGLWDVLDECQQRALTGEITACHERLREDGHLTAAPWQSNGAALTVRVRNGGAAMVDPAGTEEPQSLCLVEARDLNEAIRLAGGMPEAHLGRIEVWALQEGEREP